MTEVDYIQECDCGAITVSFPNGASNSMSRKEFDCMDFVGDWAKTTFGSCDHCVNHWGLDLCECGSGELVGECECGSMDASQNFGEQRPFIGFRF